MTIGTPLWDEFVANLKEVKGNLLVIPEICCTFAIAIDLQFPRFALSYGGRGDFSYLVQRYKIYITLQIN